MHPTDCLRDFLLPTNNKGDITSERAFLELLLRLSHAIVVPTLLCKWCSLNKGELFVFCSFSVCSSRSDDNKRKNLISIYLWKCAAAFSFLVYHDTFSIKQKTRPRGFLLLFQLFFLIKGSSFFFGAKFSFANIFCSCERCLRSSFRYADLKSCHSRATLRVAQHNMLCCERLGVVTNRLNFLASQRDYKFVAFLTVDERIKIESQTVDVGWDSTLPTFKLPCYETTNFDCVCQTDKRRR